MNQGGEEHKNTIFVVYDPESGGVWSFVVLRQGVYSEYVAKRIAAIIDRLGHARCVI